MFYRLTTILFMLLVSTQVAIGAEDRLLQIDSGGHVGTIKSVIITPNGEQIISAGDDKIIRVWDRATGETIRTIRGEIGKGAYGKIFAMALSTNGKWLAVAGWMDADDAGSTGYCCGDIRIFDFASGSLSRLLKGHFGPVYDLDFSSDGQLLASGSRDGQVIVWNLSNDPGTEEIHAFVAGDDFPPTSQVLKVEFINDLDRIAATTLQGDLYIWSWSERAVIAHAKAHNSPVRALTTFVKGQVIATGSETGNIRFWSLVDGRSVGETFRQTGAVGALEYSGNGESLLSTCSTDCGPTPEQNIWNVANGKVVSRYKGHNNTVRAGSISSDGRSAVTAGGDSHEIHVWSIEDALPIKQLRGQGQPVWAVGITKSAEQIAWGNKDPCPGVRACPNALSDLQWTFKLPVEDKAIERIEPLTHEVDFLRAVDKRGDLSLTTTGNQETTGPHSTLHFLREDDKVRSFERDNTNGVAHVAFSLNHNNSEIISGGYYGLLMAYPLANSRPEYFVGHTNQVNALALSTDGRFLVSGSTDQTVRIWNAATRELLVSLFVSKTRDWIIWTPQGYYHASSKGDRFVGWHINRGPERTGEYTTARQLRKHLHNPWVVRRALLLGSARQAVEQLRGSAPNLTALLQLSSPKFGIQIDSAESSEQDGYVQIEVRESPGSSSITRMEVLVDQRNVTPVTTAGFAEPVDEEGKFAFSIPVAVGSNEILVTAYNEANIITERAARIVRNSKGALDELGNLHVVTIGINKYDQLPPICNGRSCDLNYAVNDAKKFGMLQYQARTTTTPLYNHIKITSVYEGGDIYPSKENIAELFETSSINSRPQDTTILLIASHGTNYDGEYYFVPANARATVGGVFDKQSLVKWTQINDFLHKSPGTKILLVDTCHAANAYNSQASKNSSDSRIVFLSATAKDKFSRELENLQHGVFSYALINGMKGGADTKKRGIIRILDLLLYTSDEVGALTNFEQETHTDSSKPYKNFTIAQYPRAVQ